ncbi:hypothetical protein [Colwellia sp. BRX9-1]|uniref:hypothetical protein n=1 Tax=Colwellia sp. BRX9-1 TaxID=2759830 RepID=UPI0015F3A846|nr:hypothetical protein [Colwellia sp. BRX9-1]MBA6352841.1 hypothetical protein [Colwellia sp. BRX9-1]
MVAIFSVILIKYRPVIFDGVWLSALIKGGRELIDNRERLIALIAGRTERQAL